MMESRAGSTMSMAATVNIAKTHHLTYSPLSDKHNVLYDRARRHFRSRSNYSQRVRFNINPILDKESTKGVVDEKFKPEVLPGMQPPASLTIVENLSSDTPVLTKQFSIGAFWEFLFSDTWSRDHSVRVLEGPLQTLIIGTLVKLSKTGEVTNHSTRAFAKNIHKRRPIHKHPDKNAPDLGDCDETLYLEFTYYGRSAKQYVSNTWGEAADSGDYAYDDTSSVGSGGGYACAGTTSECMVTSETMTSTEDMSASSSPSNGSVAREHVVPSDSVTSGERAPDNNPDVASRDCVNISDRQGSSSSIKLPVFTPAPPVEDITIKSASSTDNDVTGARSRRRTALRRRIKSAPVDRNRVQTPSTRRHRYRRLEKEDDTKFDARHDSSSSDDDGVAADDLRDFRCTERVQYLGEFDLPSDDSDSSSEERDDAGFQQEFYLGEKIPRQAWSSTKQKLRARRTELQRERADARRNLELLRSQPKPREDILPTWSELDVYKYLTEDEIERLTHVEPPERVPTFEEYCQKMAFDEELKARSRGGPRRKFTESIIRLSLIKSGHERFADQIIGLTEIAPEHCFKRDPTFVALLEHMKHEYLEKINLAKGNFFKKLLEQSNDILVGSRMRLGVPDIFLTTPTGVTYLHPVCHKIARKYKRKEKKKRLKQWAGSIRMKKHIMRLWKRDTVSSESDDDAEIEKEVLGKSPFDTTKIKVTYSEERLGKFDERKRLQAELGRILQRFRRVKSVLFKFGRGASPFRSRMTGTRARVVPATVDTERKQVQKKVNVITVGKLRWFPFLNSRTGADSTDAKSEYSVNSFGRSTKSVRWSESSCSSTTCGDDSTVKTDSSSQYAADGGGKSSFSNFSERALVDNLVQALEQFVVRREIVVSDQKSSTSVSVTFTRKSVFTRPKSAPV